VRLENSFEVAAPVEQAWRLLNDVPRVVACMPGAELTETVGEDAWRGVVHVKLGPMALRFGADVERQARDDETHTVVLVTNAREVRGRGNAQATIQSSLRGDGAKTNVEIVTELSLQGAVAQFGRGIVPQVAAQLTKQFADNVAALIEGSHPEPAPVQGVRVGVRALWSNLARLVHRG
jgi:carbon monoxide dehydrogenase subunit G